MRYYIADQHFYHRSLLSRMDNRGFPDVESMNIHMIERWNSKVKPKDEVVILGDFSYGNAEQTNELLEQLNGKKMLIVGNHDCRYLDNKSFDRSKFKWIKNYAELNENKRRIILCHYPIMCYNGQYRRNGNGMPKTYMLHGHVHNTLDQKYIDDYRKRMEYTYRKASGYSNPLPVPAQIINTFCMYSDYVPLTLDEWIKLDNKRLMNPKYEGGKDEKGN